MKYNKIGVIGAGTMGIGITIDLVLHNIDTVLVDISTDVLEKAKQDIINGIRFAPLVKKSLPRILPEDALKKIMFTTKIEDVSACSFIIENVTEKLSIKQGIYSQLSKILKEDICIGVNTSCISITKIAAMTNRPDKIIGMHIMNPAFMKPVVEVIRGYHTSEITIDSTKEMLAQLEKKAIVVKDYPGFVSNRISHLFMNEAAFVIQDNVAEPKQVDEIFRECFGHTMGPLQTADLIGLDTVVDSLDVLYESYQDSKFRCCPLLRKMVAAGLLGKKSGHGFYKYTK